jgi:hypothetical protein
MTRKKEVIPDTYEGNLITGYLRELLTRDPDEVQREWGGKLTGAQRVATALFSKMEMGDVSVLREGLDRIEGKTTAKKEEEKKATLRITYGE